MSRPRLVVNVSPEGGGLVDRVETSAGGRALVDLVGGGDKGVFMGVVCGLIDRGGPRRDHVPPVSVRRSSFVLTMSPGKVVGLHGAHVISILLKSDRHEALVARDVAHLTAVTNQTLIIYSDSGLHLGLAPNGAHVDLAEVDAVLFLSLVHRRGPILPIELFLPSGQLR